MKHVVKLILDNKIGVANWPFYIHVGLITKKPRRV